MISKELLDKVNSAKPKVCVVGIGGAGCNISTWIADKKLTGGKIIAANTDAGHLATCKADHYILLGEKMCKGLGCGGFPERGAGAAKEKVGDIAEILKDSNLVFLVAGFGGGTGTGATPVIAEITKELGILTVACVTIPFSIEASRRQKARDAIKILANACDSVVLIDNSKLKEVAGNLPLTEAFGVANSLVGSFVKNITDTVTLPSLVNLDFADLNAVMEGGGIASIGIGEGGRNDRVSKAVAQALGTPLLEIDDISSAHGVLIHITGGDDMTLEEVAAVGEQIMDKVPNTRQVIWGANIDPAFTGKVKVMAVLTGVTSTFINGEKKQPAAAKLPPEVAKPIRKAIETYAQVEEERINSAAVLSVEKPRDFNDIPFPKG